MKRFSLVTLFLLLGVFATTASAAPKHVSIVIHHQTHGCHAWAVGANGVYKPTLKVVVARGATLTFVNNDVMPQKIVQKAGSVVARP